MISKLLVFWRGNTPPWNAGWSRGSYVLSQHGR